MSSDPSQNLRRDEKNALARTFCELPFTFAEIHRDGDVYLCCPSYSGRRAVGNVFRDKPDAIWNSKMAQRIRAGVLDGSYSHCDHKACPAIAGRSLPPRQGFETCGGALAGVIRESMVALPRGPDIVKLCHDDSCNLSCPSCRRHTIVAGKDRQAALDRVVQDFILPFLVDTRQLVLSGDGDPFASKHYRDVLKATAEKHPRLRIGLHTNGVLCDARAWDDCRLRGRVDSVEVSIDAATAETYDVVRRGGDFARLKRNLAFLSGLRAAGEIKELEFSFVVQARNYREMPAFVEMATALGVDLIRFALIRYWGRGLGTFEFPRHCVWNRHHPQFDDFLAVLRDPRITDARVWAGDLLPFIAEARGAPPPRRELTTVLRERMDSWISV